MQPASALPEADWDPMMMDPPSWAPAHPQVTSQPVHPRLVHLLMHCGLEYWIPHMVMFESERRPSERVCKSDETFAALGPQGMKQFFKDANARFSIDLLLPHAQIDEFISLLAPGAAAPVPTPEPEPAAAVEQRWTFEQTDHEARLTLRGLPLGTKAKDVQMESKQATLALAVHGDVILPKDSRLYSLVHADETDFNVEDEPGGRMLTVCLTKYSPGKWPALLDSVATTLPYLPYLDPRLTPDMQVHDDANPYWTTTSAQRTAFS